MTVSSFQVRPCANVKEALAAHYDWAITEQWDAGKDGNDIKLAFYPIHPAGFLIGTVKNEDQKDKNTTDEKTVSCIVGTKYDDDTGFIALYIVGDPSDRGKGYGLRVFNQALEDLSSSHWIGINAVQEQVSNYQKSGFVLHPHGAITRFNGRKKKDGNNKTATTTNVVDILEVPLLLEKMIDRDHRSCGIRRPTFINHWVNYNATHGWALALMDRQGEGEEKKAVGFGCMRPLASGMYRIGPLYADTLDYAVELANQLISKVPDNAKFTTDAWMATPEASELFQNKLGWTPIVTFYQLWRKGGTRSEDEYELHPPPFEAPLGNNGNYSIAAIEIG